MIGLERHTVNLVEHRSYWIDIAEDLCKELQSAGTGLLNDVQHVGSTAVPDLLAKPILDIVAGIQTFDLIPQLIETVTDVGYIYRGEDKTEKEHLFVWESSPQIRTIHLHVVLYNKIQWKSYLFFRDLLRRDSDIRNKYAELKIKLLKKYPENRKAYTANKHNFIRRILITYRS